MKALAAFAIAIIGMAIPVSAQTEMHPGTVAALRCLVEHDHKTCRHGFVGGAATQAGNWLWQDPRRDVELGSLVSADYAGTENDSNTYVSKFLGGHTVDVYDVKFRHHEMTFYIAPPEADGNVHNLLIRRGSPSDERRELFIRGPG